MSTRIKSLIGSMTRVEWALLSGLVLLAVVLRFRNIDSGLPIVYNIDENARFVPDAASYFSRRLEFRELVNPPGMMQVLAAIYQVWFRLHDLNPVEGLQQYPSQAYAIGRGVSALFGVAAVPVLYLAGRRLVGRSGAMIAAGLLAVSFLAVAYSRLALADGPTVFFIVCGIYFAARILDSGRWLDYLLMGATVGLASGFKYNAGIVVLAGLAAAAIRLRSDGVKSTILKLIGLGIAALVAFIASNPYLVLDPEGLYRALRYQAIWASNSRYVGEARTNGFDFYLWSSAWGIGIAPLIAAALGAVLMVVKRWRSAALLLPMAIIYLLIMGTQMRYFARWVLPIVPAIALSAGLATAWLGDRLFALLGAGKKASGSGPQRAKLRLAFIAVVALGLGAQSLIHSAHLTQIAGRQDTRDLLRTWMVKNIPKRSGIVLESMAPPAWMPSTPNKVSPKLEPTPYWDRYHTIPAIIKRDAGRHPQLRVKAGFSGWVKTLYPGLIKIWRKYGYCYVVTGSYQAGRVAATPELVPEAKRFYEILPKRADLVYQQTPFASVPGQKFGPLESKFKYQIDREATSYELGYERPGPLVSVYKLRGGRCDESDPIVPNPPI